MSVPRREFLTLLGGAMAGMPLAARGRTASSNSQEPRPNILWITCEDMSPHLGCFGDPEAVTPNLDQLASEGRRYTNAFSVSGVCAPSRSCLITGMHPTTLGTNHMRCSNPPPDYVKCFPEYLRAAGYYCTNNHKTDYNFPVPSTAWDESSSKAHWRSRPDKDQPFFSVFNFTITHESVIGTPPDEMSNPERALLPETRHNPANAILPPYFPDTPLVREYWAHYYDLVTAMDTQVGAVLKELEEDELAESTVVMFYSDHGVGLPRCKRWLWDSGLHVPLIVRWPGSVEPASVTDRLVSFVDFAPTALAIADVPVPDHMQGSPFLGAQAAEDRQYIYAARDRMDERYDILRAVRDKRFKYIRNYEPYRPYAQYIGYSESYPVLQEMRRAFEAGEANAVQAQFFAESKPPEELYDLAADPHEINNLASSPEHLEVLDRLRVALDVWMDETHDLAFVPEPELPKWIPYNRPDLPQPEPRPAYSLNRSPGSVGSVRSVYGKELTTWLDQLNQGTPLQRLKAIQSLAACGPEAALVLVFALRDPDPSVVYWAAVGLGALGEKEMHTDIEALLGHDSPTVRLGAGRALAMLGAGEAAIPALIPLCSHEDPSVRLLAVQVFEAMGPTSVPVRLALQRAAEDANGDVAKVARHVLGIPVR